MKPRLRKKYEQEVLQSLQKELGLKNSFAVPRIEKIVLNMGASQPQEPRQRQQVIENIVEQFKIIAGQAPQITRARRSIAGFKLREGDPLGVMVTLRGKRMWEFLDKLIHIVLPRVKDFKGVSRTAFDSQGNYSLGLEEQIVFPEINYDEIEQVRGLQINIISNTKDDQQAFRLLELLEMPFSKEEE